MVLLYQQARYFMLGLFAPAALTGIAGIIEIFGMKPWR
jgi:hypothetical protein